MYRHIISHTSSEKIKYNVEKNEGKIAHYCEIQSIVRPINFTAVQEIHPGCGRNVGKIVHY